MNSSEEIRAIKVIAYGMAKRALKEKGRGRDAVMRQLNIDRDELMLKVAQECAKAIGYEPGLKT